MSYKLSTRFDTQTQSRTSVLCSLLRWYFRGLILNQMDASDNNWLHNMLRHNGFESAIQFEALVGFSSTLLFFLTIIIIIARRRVISPPSRFFHSTFRLLSAYSRSPLKKLNEVMCGSLGRWKAITPSTRYWNRKCFCSLVFRFSRLFVECDHRRTNKLCFSSQEWIARRIEEALTGETISRRLMHSEKLKNLLHLERLWWSAGRPTDRRLCNGKCYNFRLCHWQMTNGFARRFFLFSSSCTNTRRVRVWECLC